MGVELGQMLLPFLWIRYVISLQMAVDVIEYMNGFLNIETSLYTWGKSHVVMLYNVLNTMLASIC